MLESPTMQRGTLRKEYGGWYLRFWEPTTDGRRKRCVRLAPCDEDHPHEASVALLAAQVLDPFNRKQVSPESSMTVAKFIEEVYLPHVRRELRPSTAKDYDDVFRVHLHERLGDIRLRDFRTLHGQRILRDVEGVGHTSRLRIKSFLSGVFKHARREGTRRRTRRQHPRRQNTFRCPRLRSCCAPEDGPSPQRFVKRNCRTLSWERNLCFCALT